jgi:diacylglycerol kinase family enzyme
MSWHKRPMLVRNDPLPAMRITLVHNPTAGVADHRLEEILASLRRAGHEAIDGDLEAIHRKPPSLQETDLVLAAGGDGTVRKVALAMAGSKVPVGVLPLGTANNLAHSLELERPVPEIIANLDSYRPCGFDLGIAIGPWGKFVFMEGFGAGLFADYLSALDTPGHRDWMEALRDEQGLHRDYVFLPQLLAGYESRGWDLRVDGNPIRGDFFLVEALNTKCIGPFSELAPRADPGDGFLDLVTLGPDEIETFCDLLTAHAEGNEQPFPFPVRRFRELELRSRDEYLHFDDHLWPNENRHAPSSLIRVSVQPSALFFLRPPQ